MRSSALRCVILTGVLLAGVLASGCGFHLRGAVVVPESLQQTTLRAVDPNSLFVKDLRRQMSASGVQLFDDVRPGASILDITQEDFKRRVLTVGSTGKAQEYEVHYTVGFRVTGSDGEEILPLQELQLSRAFLFDELDVLGKANEEVQVRKTLQQDMVRLVLMRLEALGR